MKNKALALLLVLVLCVGLAGCGGSTQPSEGAATFRIGAPVAIDTLNPLSSYMQLGFEVFLLLYDPLVRYDENYEPVGCLAENWSVSDDQLTWTFQLRDGVTWHDGEPFTSKDVKFTYDLMADSGLGYMYSSYLTGITDIECPDDLTVVIKTEEPKANMLMNTTPILPEHIWSQVSKDELEVYTNENPVGTGPFKFDSSSQGVIKLVRNDSYFGKVPSMDECVFVKYDNSDTLAQALSLGEIDAAVSLNPAQKNQLENDKNVTLISGEIPGFTQIGINCWTDAASSGNPLLKDKTVRQAIEYAIDKEKIVQMAYGGEGEAGTTLLNPGQFYHYEPAGDELRSYNIEKGNELLDQAGYQDTDGDGIRENAAGDKLEFSLITIADNSEEIKAGQLIVSDCQKIGISIKNETMDDGALQDQINAGSFDMFIWGWGGDVDPSVILELITTDQIGGNNEPHFSNPRYDELFLKQMTMMDEKERQAAVFEMQKIAYDEAPYIILLYDNNLQAIRSDKWTGFKQMTENGPFFLSMAYDNYLNIKPAQ
jgi:peptide/nickel transport system substrate-binding protein